MTNTSNKNLYELVVLLSNSISPVEVQSFFQSCLMVGDANSISIKSNEYVGLCKLAYPIKKASSAHIYIAEVEMSPDVMSELILKLRISEFLLRHMIVLKDKSDTFNSFVFKKESDDDENAKILISKDPKYSIGVKK